MNARQRSILVTAQCLAEMIEQENGIGSVEAADVNVAIEALLAQFPNDVLPGKVHLAMFSGTVIACRGRSRSTTEKWEDVTCKRCMNTPTFASVRRGAQPN